MVSLLPRTLSFYTIIKFHEHKMNLSERQDFFKKELHTLIDQI